MFRIRNVKQTPNKYATSIQNQGNHAVNKSLIFPFFSHLNKTNFYCKYLIKTKVDISKTLTCIHMTLTHDM